MKLTAIDVAHAVAYTLPGLVLWASVGVLWATGHRAAAYENAPRWARRYYRAATVVLFVIGGGLLALGVGVASTVLRS